MNLRKLYESGRALSLTEATRDLELIAHLQQNLIRLGLLEPPADGRNGPITGTALREFQTALNIKEDWIGQKTCRALIETRDLEHKQLKFGTDFASQIARYYRAQNWYVAANADELNICYVEGANADGSINSDAPNEWNDRRIIWQINDGVPVITGNWRASCEPGWWYTLNPMNPEGCARIRNPAQYKAWRIGVHGGSKPHPALVQVAPVQIYRDRNRDMQRTGDPLRQGLFGINQHWGYGMEHVDRASAGCMTAPDWNGHNQFIQDCKSDRRYWLNQAYTFVTAFIPGDKLWTAPPTTK